MSDTDNTTPTPTPAPAPVATTETKAETDVKDLEHDGERAARHGLSHLEDEFVAKMKALGVHIEDEAKKLLAWIASKA